ncbi:MAG: c-type cytochrome [Rhodospirillales bacterium]|nr:c-type cytochrome [Rhodospirillales bacterium]
MQIQKMLGALLFALILTVGVGLLGDIVFPTHEPQPEDETAAVAGKEAPAQAPEQTGQPAPAQASLEQLLASADVSAGKAVAKKCTACHTFDEGGANRVGPNLHGVVGADIAAKAGFSYSKGLAGKEGAWTIENLDAFLTKPAQWAPGTKMTFAGVSEAKDRADLIAYLHSISPDAPPLPEASAKAAPEAQPAEEPAEEAPAEQAPADEPPKQPAEQASGESERAAVAAPSAPEAGGNGGLVAMIAQATPDQGKKAIRKCTACHTFDEGGGNRVGPNLHGVVGADIASKEYRYSDALAGKDGAWTHENLDAFLTNPAGWAPGTKMTFAGIKQAEERAAVIAYLRSISPGAPPL